MNFNHANTTDNSEGAKKHTTMLRAKELRVGSLFLGIAGVQTVKSILDFKDRADWNGKDAEDGYEHLILVNENRNQYKPCEIEGIPITTEWLERLGFTLHSKHDFHNYRLPNGFHISMWSLDERVGGFEEKGVFYWGDNYLTVRYVHQLQNLFFVMHGQDLQTK